MQKCKAVLMALVVGIVALAVAACGSGSKTTSSGSTGGGSSTSSSSTPAIPLKAGEDASKESLSQGAKQGGTLTVLSSEDFEHLDPGQAYFSLDYEVVYAMQRPLLVYMPNSQTQLAPDLATAVPTTSNGGISSDGKTVTVHIEPNVKFAPPVNRVVTTADVKYAIERLANKNVGNGYFSSYFSDIVGASGATGGNISGITTPNATTIVFKLTKPVANTLVQALSLPGTAPVPETVVAPLDKSAPTKFGVSELTSTGPYMIQGQQNGNSITAGFNPAKSLTLVKNPNWSASTYAGPYKPPAYLSTINIQNGGSADVIGPQVLKGNDEVQLDTPTRATVQTAYEKYPSQITFTTGAGDHYMTLDNAHGIFTNVNIRRAVYANLDRQAIIKLKGGALTGEPGTGFITPGTAGFDESGGYAGPKYPWNENTNGSLSVAEKYMKAAGFPSGKYTGSQQAVIVGANNSSDSEAVNQLVVKDMNALGIKTKLIQVDQSVMYEKYCQVPKSDTDACPSGGWIRDFNDAFSILFPTFSSTVITPTLTENFGSVDDKTLDGLMNQAQTTVDPTQAAQLWGKANDRIIEQAEAVPEDFDIQPNIFSKGVDWVGDLWNVGSVDLAYTGLK